MRRNERPANGVERKLEMRGRWGSVANWRRAAELVHRHEHDLRLGDHDPLALPASPALRLDGDLHGDGRAAHAHRLGEEVDDVAQEDRLVELDLTHGLGDVAVAGDLAGLHRRSEVDVREDDASEDRAEGVGVLGQKDHLDRGDADVRHDAKHSASRHPGIDCPPARYRSRNAMRDPRPYQIATLALLLSYGLIRLGFDVPALHVFLILGTALLTQRVLTDAYGLSRFDPRSALISGLSLCLL